MIIVRFQMSNNCQFNRQRHSIRKCALFYWNIKWLYLQNTERQTQLNVNYIQCYTHVVMASIQPKPYIQLYPWEQCSIRSHIAPTYLLYGTAPSQNHVWRIWILDSKIATKPKKKTYSETFVCFHLNNLNQCQLITWCHCPECAQHKDAYVKTTCTRMISAECFRHTCWWWVRVLAECSWLLAGAAMRRD